MTRSFLFFTALLFLSSCSWLPKAPLDERPSLVLKPAKFSELPGWQHDRHENVVKAFSRSCARILKADPDKSFGPEALGGKYRDWHTACLALDDIEPAQVKSYFERHFLPWQVLAGPEEKGLFTGYYEAALNGSRSRYGSYQYPLRRRPDDLVMVDLGEFRDELRGQRIAGRVQGAYLKPYENREEIEKGRLKDDDYLVIAWVDSPVDAFFLHIQGSGRINLNDGSYLRVGYDGQNGHPYYAIGRELIKRGYLEKEEVSMQSIRAWLETHPEEAFEIMNTNKSYVFFRELEEKGPLGGEGVALTPGRSLAVDYTQIPYGTPVFVDVEAPLEGKGPLERLMVAQDTGGAIRGAVRGDVFWGAGERAEYIAGHMKSQGRYWLLLPKELEVNKAKIAKK